MSYLIHQANVESTHRSGNSAWKAWQEFARPREYPKREAPRAQSPPSCHGCSTSATSQNRSALPQFRQRRSGASRAIAQNATSQPWLESSSSVARKTSTSLRSGHIARSRRAGRTHAPPLAQSSAPPSHHRHSRSNAARLRHVG